MLVLKRKEGQWVEITHHSGDVLRIRVCRIEGGNPGGPGQLNLAFDDDARHFEIERPERKRRQAERDHQATQDGAGGQVADTPASSALTSPHHLGGQSELSPSSGNASPKSLEILTAYGFGPTPARPPMCG